ncbi:endonuclease YncB(thermonuclease family) [Orenia metallireducens]|uniref:Endonuclease YncB, thermonuclease family n=1 Tax=Orenia metallireducens TaxID=1413210 RepID=A0A285IDU8_9FIRM|nr:thermonuclease family protein [Orenia metallireducens]PRX20626.1 endonuclease YncB(thermonuclease family) [Orenia metallireducens]SNY45246.1 Endonuclease YncB, thermonuclease family [Orenia metallireducens]
MLNNQVVKVLILILSYFLLEKEDKKTNNKVEEAKVVEHVDGDTCYVRLLNGRKEAVRFIGVNAPELDQPYGKEASEYTETQLLNKKVYLEKDVSQRDRYSRLLRYIWLNPIKEVTEKEIRANMFNAILLLEGYAQVDIYPPDIKYSEYFRKFEKEAKENNKGLWRENKEIELIELTEVVKCGDYAKITIKAIPEVKYNIAVYYKSGMSRAVGLKEKIADDSGQVSWEWKVGCKTSKGIYPIIITGNEEEYKVELIVTK